ncbi:unnamed protein product [Phaeothamnion confervicola]
MARGGGLGAPRSRRARMQVMITRNMRRVLTEELGYLPEEVDDMEPQIAAVVIERELPRPRTGMPIAWRKSFSGKERPPGIISALRNAVESVMRAAGFVGLLPLRVVSATARGLYAAGERPVRGGTAIALPAAAVVGAAALVLWRSGLPGVIFDGMPPAGRSHDDNDDDDDFPVLDDAIDGGDVDADDTGGGNTSSGDAGSNGSSAGGESLNVVPHGGGSGGGASCDVIRAPWENDEDDDYDDHIPLAGIGASAGSRGGRSERNGGYFSSEPEPVESDSFAEEPSTYVEPGLGRRGSSGCDKGGGGGSGSGSRGSISGVAEETWLDRKIGSLLDVLWRGGR